MRFPLPLIAVLTMTACAPNGDAGNSQSAIQHPAPGPTGRMLGEEPATSPSAVQARQTVERYFKLIDAHKYGEAYLLWGDQGRDTRGSPEQFAATFAPYSEYRQTVGEPTAIKVADGRQYILVTATIDVKNKKSGKTAHREGTVMLRRSADPRETAPDKKEWRIWGTDIRVQH